MIKPRTYRLGDLQLRIMQVLWERQHATVAEVHAALADERNLAYTTIATMLRKMEDRALVSHRLEGRSFVYHAAVPVEAASQGVVDPLPHRLFVGILAEMVHPLPTNNHANVYEPSLMVNMVILQMSKSDR